LSFSSVQEDANSERMPNDEHSSASDSETALPLWVRLKQASEQLDRYSIPHPEGGELRTSLETLWNVVVWKTLDEQKRTHIEQLVRNRESPRVDLKNTKLFCENDDYLREIAQQLQNSGDSALKKVGVFLAPEPPITVNPKSLNQYFRIECGSNALAHHLRLDHFILPQAILIQDVESEQSYNPIQLGLHSAICLQSLWIINCSLDLELCYTTFAAESHGGVHINGCKSLVLGIGATLFNGHVRITECQLGVRYNSYGSGSNADASIPTIFKASFLCINNKIEGHGNFSGCHFEKEANFSGCEFLAPVDFSQNVRFSTCHFSQCKFWKDASFKNAEFNGGAFFQDAEFFQSALFDGA
jgi:hypothetical protein